MARPSVPTEEAVLAALAPIVCAEDYLRFLDFQRSFRRYSLANRCLIWSQRPNATYCKGFLQWKTDHNRWVKKGERGIAINVPIKYSRAEVRADPNLDGQIKGFQSGYVFDISQTDGEPVPAITLTPPNLAPDHAYNTMLSVIHFTTNQPVQHPIDLDPNIDGTYNRGTRAIAVKSDYANTRYGVAIAAHEFAHYLDHVTHSPDTVYLPHGVSYRECELVAETATWMFLKDINHLDMDTQKGAFEYIRSYTQGDLNDIKAALPRAFACHRLMLDAWDAITTITEHVP